MRMDKVRNVQIEEDARLGICIGNKLLSTAWEHKGHEITGDSSLAFKRWSWWKSIIWAVGYRMEKRTFYATQTTEPTQEF
jgi:hypothetical protein